MAVVRGRDREQFWLALMLAWVAGSVDAIGYLTLARLFTAHMSGNSARLGVRLGRGELAPVLPLAVAVGLFVAGVALGTVIAELAARRRIAAIAAVVLTVQAALLAGFLAFIDTALRGRTLTGRAGVDFYVPAALAILSMGVQLTALQQVAGKVVRTSYVSGVLTSFAQETVNWLFWLRDGPRRDEHWSYLSRVLGLGSRTESRARALVLAAVWSAYAAGATIGALTEAGWGAWALAPPLGLLLAGIVADARRPIHVQGD